MRRTLASFISAACLLAWTPAVFAQSRIWSAAGISGIVDEADQNLHLFNATGSVSIKESVSSGTLNIRYAVQSLPDLLVHQGGDCPELRVNLRDTGAGARVIVRLLALSIFPARDGAPRPVTTLGTVDSNTAEAAADPTDYRYFRACINRLPPESEFLIDYAFYAYYVEAQLIKSTGSANPGLLSVQICASQDACDP
jgi:hypothetical protein